MDIPRRCQLYLISSNIHWQQKDIIMGIVDTIKANTPAAREARKHAEIDVEHRGLCRITLRGQTGTHNPFQYQLPYLRIFNES